MDDSYTRFVALANEIGYADAYAEVYGESNDSPKEFARRLCPYLEIDDITALVWLRYGSNSNSMVQRWLNDATREKHNKRKRERFHAARKYAKNLASRGFPLNVIQQRVREKFNKEYAGKASGWTKHERTRYLAEQGLSLEEIAEHEGLTVEGIESRLKKLPPRNR